MPAGAPPGPRSSRPGRRTRSRRRPCRQRRSFPLCGTRVPRTNQTTGRGTRVCLPRRGGSRRRDPRGPPSTPRRARRGRRRVRPRGLAPRIGAASFRRSAATSPTPKARRLRGLPPRKEPPSTPELAVGDPEYLRQLRGNVKPAPGSMDSHLHPQHHALTSLPRIDDVQLHVADELGLTRQVGGDGIPAAYYARVGKVGRIVKLDLGGKKLLDGILHHPRSRPRSLGVQSPRSPATSPAQYLALCEAATPSRIPARPAKHDQVPRRPPRPGPHAPRA